MVNHYFKKIVFIVLSILSVSQHSIAQQIDPAALVKALQDPQVMQAFMATMNKAKEISSDSLSKNFSESSQGFIDGFHSIALGISRLTRDSSQNFAELANSLAKHYWVLGGMIVSGTLLYLYVLPRIRWCISFSSDDPRNIRR